MNLPGRLRMTTLGDLLATLHRAEATGTLELAEDSGRRHRVYFSKGYVVSVEIDGASPTLSEMLRDEPSIDDGLCKRAFLRAVTSNRLHGDVLVRDFHVRGEVVAAALRRQITTRLEQLDRLHDARVLFRVAIRAPRGALTDSPVEARQFLPGMRRARDAAASTPRPCGAQTGADAPAPPSRSPHSVLGVPASATELEIRRAYRRLARAFHPDLHPSASEDERRALTERFTNVTEAFRALVA